jgi:hypothetical protein
MTLFGRTNPERELVYDRAVVELASGERRVLSPAEFQSLPLNERVSVLLHKRVKFFRGEVEVSARDALKER